MKINSTEKEKGSVLITAMFTITIVAMICATSLFVMSQNTSTGVQTAGWQQALTGAEMGIDTAIRALNENGIGSANAWTNWKTVSSILPSPSPSGSPVQGFTYEPTGVASATATAPPTSSQYNYLPSTTSQMIVNYPNSEGTASVSAWVTIDTAGGLSDSSGSWYRIRSTGQVSFKSNSVYRRVSNNRLDNDLRNTLALNFNRKGSSNAGPTRTIEVVVAPVPKGGSAKGITLSGWLQMTGGGSADSFSSPNGQWSSVYRDPTNPLLVAEGATGNSAKFANTGQTYVYGGVSYSGTAPTNVNANSGNPPVKDVLGQVSTPASVSLPAPTDPVAVSGNSGHYNWTNQDPWDGVTTTYSALNSSTISGGNTTVTASGTASSPTLLIVNGDFTVSGGQTFTINATKTGSPPTVSPSNSYLIIWVKGGQFTTSGSGTISQAAGTNVTWIVDKDITVSGNSYQNLNGTAATDSFVGVGTNNKFTDSGSATFTGTVNAPAYAGTISGSGDFTGAFAGANLTISGSGGFHYDEALSGGSSNPAVGNYAFASWFEDNSDPIRKARDVSNALHPIVY